MITSCAVDGGNQGSERCPKSPAGKGQCWVLSSGRLAPESLYSSHHALFFCLGSPACIFMSYVWAAEGKVWESVFHYIPLCTFGPCEVSPINIFKPNTYF